MAPLTPSSPSQPSPRGARRGTGKGRKPWPRGWFCHGEETELFARRAVLYHVSITRCFSKRWYLHWGTWVHPISASSSSRLPHPDRTDVSERDAWSWHITEGWKKAGRKHLPVQGFHLLYYVGIICTGWQGKAPSLPLHLSICLTNFTGPTPVGLGLPQVQGQSLCDYSGSFATPFL